MCGEEKIRIQVLWMRANFVRATPTIQRDLAKSSDWGKVSRPHRALILKKVGRKALIPRILGTPPPPPGGVDQILIFLIKNQYFWSFIFDVFQCLSTGLFGFQTFLCLYLANTSFTMLIANLLLTLELTIQLNINMPLTISISRRGWALVKTKIRMVNALYTIGQIDIWEMVTIPIRSLFYEWQHMFQ